MDNNDSYFEYIHSVLNSIYKMNCFAENYNCHLLQWSNIYFDEKLLLTIIFDDLAIIIRLNLSIYSNSLQTFLVYLHNFCGIWLVALNSRRRDLTGNAQPSNDGIWRVAQISQYTTLEPWHEWLLFVLLLLVCLQLINWIN